MKTISKVLLLLIILFFDHAAAIKMCEFWDDFYYNEKNYYSYASFFRDDSINYNDYIKRHKDLYLKFFPETRTKFNDGIYILYRYDSAISKDRFIRDNLILGYIPTLSDSIYLYLIPGYPSNNLGFAYPEWSSCIWKHIEANKTGCQKYCTKTKIAPEEIEIQLKEMSVNKTLSLSTRVSRINVDARDNISMVRIEKNNVYEVSIDNINELKNDFMLKNPLLISYKTLFDLVRKTVKIDFNGCVWSNLINNIQPFIQNTDFPTHDTNFVGSCPDTRAPRRE